MPDKQINNGALHDLVNLLNSDAFLVREKTTIFNNLGVRASYYFISWIILGFGIQVGNGFFVATLLFISSLLMDYLKTTSEQQFHKKLISTERFICAIFFIGSFLGLVGIFEIKNFNDLLIVVISDKFIAFNGFHCSLDIIWYSLIIPTALTIIDWLTTKSALEEKLILLYKEQSKNKGD